MFFNNIPSLKGKGFKRIKEISKFLERKKKEKYSIRLGDNDIVSVSHKPSKPINNKALNL